MQAGLVTLGYGGTVPNGGLDTIAGGITLLVAGLVVLLASSSRAYRVGAAGLILWGACLVIPIAIGRA